MDMTEEVKKSKYAAQLKYDKKKREEDPVYKAERNEKSRLRNKERYNTDPEYRQHVINKSKEREAKIRAFYKNNVQSLGAPIPV